MTTADEIPSDLTLALSETFGPEEFLSAVKHFFGYIEEVTQAQEGDGSEVRWTVKVKEGSALIALVPSESASPSRLQMIYEKARYAAVSVARGDLLAANLSTKAIDHLKALSDLSISKNGSNVVSLWVNREPIVVGPEFARVALQDEANAYSDVGSIEGRLDAITDASGGVRIRVKDYLWAKPVTCVVPETMLESVLANFRRRVEVQGLIHYRPDGTPRSIEATSIDVLPEDSELPSVFEVRGIMADA